MDQRKAFEDVTAYTEESLARCHQLSDYVKKRMAIEEEYAKSLRKLCTSVSLTPMQEKPSGGLFGFFKTQKVIEKEQKTAELAQTSLWSTFFEIIDDTTQVAKSHTAYAESMQNQLYEPLKLSIKEMESQRKALVDQGRKLFSDLEDASNGLKKARKIFDQRNMEIAKAQTALEKVQLTPQAHDEAHLKKLQKKHRMAAEKFTEARQSFRLQEETLKSLQIKLYNQELPRIMDGLGREEGGRNREALSFILGLIELERRCAVMNEGFANEMALKLKRVNVTEDDRNFHHRFIDIPRPLISPSIAALDTTTISNAPYPTPVPISRAAPAEMVISSPPNVGCPISINEIPRTYSMPPAYQSQESADLKEAGGAFLLHRNATDGSALMINASQPVNYSSSYPTLPLLDQPSCPEAAC